MNRANNDLNPDSDSSSILEMKTPACGFSESLMEQQEKNFYVEINEFGEPVYHWIDTRVDMLSSYKLWSILHLCEESGHYLDLAFTDAITNELINRNDFERSPKLRIQ